MTLKTVWNWKRVVMLFLIVVVGSFPLMAACKWLEVPGEWRTLVGLAWGYVAGLAFIARWDPWRIEVIE